MAESPDKPAILLKPGKWRAGFRTARIRTKLLVVLIPTVVCSLLATGYFANIVSQRYINVALERTVLTQTLALANELNLLLEQCRQDLLLFSEEKPIASDMILFAQRLIRLRKDRYVEFGFISRGNRPDIMCVVGGDRVFVIPPGSSDNPTLRQLPPSQAASELNKGDVRIGPIQQLECRFPVGQSENVSLSAQVIRLATPYPNDSGGISGFFYLGLDARKLRNVLSVYNSDQSPIWGFPRSSEVRYSFLFDLQGWILCQSEDTRDPQQELTTFLARAGYNGTLGRPEQPSAYRPASKYKYFWKMVLNVKEGGKGVIKKPDNELQRADHAKSFFMAYAPILIQSRPGREPAVIGGLANIDKSQLTLRAGYKQVDVIFIITLATIALVSLMIFILSRTITHPINRLAQAVKAIQESGELREIRLPESDHETTSLLTALKQMIQTLREQMEEIRIKDKKIELVHLKEQAKLESTPFRTNAAAQGVITELVGTGPKMDKLKSDIFKAAQVDADVLLVGETGTGKQLVADAVHRHCKRSRNPFIALNCGALDENLLLDTLFGHVKGAYTEAKADRKGAFVEAVGGILFLDDIQTATPKVQQALLRAVSLRKIVPLGSDREIDVDVRLITATNVDLKRLVDDGVFREDLYYRLNVITIHTPPLREHKESIPLLVTHFLKQAEIAINKHGLGISKGALEKITLYDWPGNIRELKHSILRAAVMSESRIIQADAVSIDALTEASAYWKVHEEKTELARKEAVNEEHDEPVPPPEVNSTAIQLNARQRKAFSRIPEGGEITRREYQQVLGDRVSARTANYDLNDMVEKGILKKEGAGPSTRYVFRTEHEESERATTHTNGDLRTKQGKPA